MTRFDDELWALVASERLNQIRELGDERERVQRLRAYSNELANRVVSVVEIHSVDFEEAAADHLLTGDLGEEVPVCR